MVAEEREEVVEDEVGVEADDSIPNHDKKIPILINSIFHFKFLHIFANYLILRTYVFLQSTVFCSFKKCKE